MNGHDLKTDEVLREVEHEKTIPLMEMFGPTIQGEGNVIGQQTYFLRFGLCDYRCRMCDSLHAVIPGLVKALGRRLTQTQIFEEFWTFRNPDSTNWVTFSGGNPAIHDLRVLTNLLQGNGMRINIETQGTKFNEYLWAVDNVTISPKGPGMGETHKQEDFIKFLDQLDSEPGGSRELQSRCYKVVLFDQRDIEFAAAIFRFLIERYGYDDLDGIFYLSLGNPNPPNPDPTIEDNSGPQFDMEEQLKNYRQLHEDIKFNPLLSKVRFLPQWHAFVWGNEKGK